MKPKSPRLAPVVCLSLTLGLSAQSGVITTIAGTGTRGFSGDDGLSLSASIALANLQNTCDPSRYEQTVHLSFDASGNLYFPDSDNQRIRQITPGQNITTVVGSGSRPSINSFCESIGSVGDGSDPKAALLYNPSDVFAASNGNLIVADQQNNRIRLVTPLGKISTIAGNGAHNFYVNNIPATASPMDWPSAVIADSTGVVYFAVLHENRVGKIGLDQKLATVAGTGIPGYNGDQIQGNTARLTKPAGIVLDPAGNLYIADQGNHRIRKVTPSGLISTIAGTGQPDFSGDGGPAAAAALNTPMDVKLDSKGNIYIADMLNQRVRRVDANGNITTVAGDGQTGRGPDGVPATSSSLNFPGGLALDANDDLYIVDWQNYLIRKVSFPSRPAIASGAVVSAASFTATVAPGGLISIFGQNLAASATSSPDVPWPTKLAGTSVKVNGIDAPLYFVSDKQINAQLPFETAAGSASVSVTNSIGTSDPVTVNVAPAAVGIFVYPGTNRAIAQNQDFTLNSQANPESRGRVVVVYLTGQGAVSPPVPTGQPASLDVLSMASQPFSATIGGVDAPVLFLGLVPGYIGLAQANILIPSSAPNGDVPMIVNVGGQPGNTAVISVH